MIKTDSPNEYESQPDIIEIHVDDSIISKLNNTEKGLLDLCSSLIKRLSMNPTDKECAKLAISDYDLAMLAKIGIMKILEEVNNGKLDTILKP